MFGQMWGRPHTCDVVGRSPRLRDIEISELRLQKDAPHEPGMEGGWSLDGSWMETTKRRTEALRFADGVTRPEN